MYEDRHAPEQHVEPQTLVFDLAEQRQVLWLEGQLPLPVGTLIELFDPDLDIHSSARVTRVRLLSAAGKVGAQVCLDCDVDATWWDRHDEAANRG